MSIAEVSMKCILIKTLKNCLNSKTMDKYKIPISEEERGINLLGALFLVHSSLSFVFIVILSLIIFMVKGFFYSRKKLASSTEKETAEENIEMTEKLEMMERICRESEYSKSKKEYTRRRNIILGG